MAVRHFDLKGLQHDLWFKLSLHHSAPYSFFVAHFSATRRKAATNEGHHHEVPAMAGSYLLEDPAGPMDLDDTPCRGYAAASPGGDEGSYEVRGGAASWWARTLTDAHP